MSDTFALDLDDLSKLSIKQLQLLLDQIKQHCSEETHLVNIQAKFISEYEYKLAYICPVLNSKFYKYKFFMSHSVSEPLLKITDVLRRINELLDEC